MAILIIIFILFLILGGSSKPTKGGFGNAIVGTGRSPMYYDIMDENYAEYEERLKQDALAGKMYKVTKVNFGAWRRGDKGVTTIVSAQQIYEDFLKYKANGYM